MSSVTAQQFTAQPLGKLVPVPLTDCWPGEASHFTPWLALEDNLAVLSDVLGMELELSQQEHPVGPFRADLVCVNSGTSRKVIIENQFNRTDHNHMGQLLTYAAGLDAESIVWIAEEFREEHRAAIDWLNRVTNENVNFFGVEVEAVRIGDSLPAPRFNVVAKPNEWTEAVLQSESGLSETNQLYLKYWTALKDHATTQATKIRLQSPSAQNWMVVSLGKTNCVLSLAVNRQKKSGWVQLVLSGPMRLAWYKQLEAQRSDIESELGSGLEWRENPAKKESHIRRTVAGLNVDDEDTWHQQHEQLGTLIARFHHAFAGRAQGLSDTGFGV